ncbi:AI-2E family transporter [Nocardia terpenica]|uniref:AI-2E family transporter n=1 Tax=Nocardia terpenica TaxID=455432 RepID=A0A164KVU9_9NOCA|nr:AI-2E family transporter [Nocardia terpenica]NQE90458.1 AI-2E family transporter [Nocardia terpenica]
MGLPTTSNGAVKKTGSVAAGASADAVHPIVRVGAEWAWRLLVLFAAVYVVFHVLQRFSTVTIPLALGLMVAALLVPIVNWLQRLGLPRSVAVIIVLVGSIGLFAGIMTFVVEQFVAGLPQLSGQFTHSVHQVQDWLTRGPLHMSQEQIHNVGDTMIKWVQKNQDTLTSAGFATAAAIFETFTGLFLTLFVVIFFLYGGGQVWHFVTKLVPTPSRAKVRHAGELAFGSLVGLMRATVSVAAVDAIGIGAGVAILGVPLALPLASIVFITAFIPVIGGALGGTVAVFVALVTKGWLTALITLGITVAVMQLESHVLQPLIMGRAVRIHPLAVVLGIAAGVVAGGIAGGFFAVPLIALLNTAIRSLLYDDDPDQEYEPLASEDTSGEPMFAAEPDKPTDPEKSDAARE